jgi:hypothetical protein
LVVEVNENTYVKLSEKDSAAFLSRVQSAIQQKQDVDDAEMKAHRLDPATHDLHQRHPCSIC